MPYLWVWHLSCLPWFPKQVEDLTRNGIWAKCPPDHQQAARWGSSQVKRAQYFCLEIPGSIGSVVGVGEICANAAKCTNANGVRSELKWNNGSTKDFKELYMDVRLHKITGGEGWNCFFNMPLPDATGTSSEIVGWTILTVYSWIRVGLIQVTSKPGLCSWEKCMRGGWLHSHFLGLPLLQKTGPHTLRLRNCGADMLERVSVTRLSWWFFGGKFRLWPIYSYRQ